MCSKIFVKIHAVLRKLHMIKHMTTHPCWPCAPLLMCPIPQGAPSLSSVLTMIPICPHFLLPRCLKRCQDVKEMSSCQRDVKLSKRCQVVKKMSSCQKDVKCQKVKHMDYGGGSQKKIKWHNEVHTYWRQFWRHIWWWPKTLKMCKESVFEQFWWPSYLTSKLTSLCVNLIMWIYFFRWFKPPYTITHGNLLTAIWDTFHWTILSNLDSRQLETSPMTSFDQFWNMSTFGNSRAVRVICQKKMPSENRSFLDEGVTRLRQG